MPEKGENLVTRINYNPRVKSALALAFFGASAFALKRLELSQQPLPSVMRGRLFGTCATPVIAPLIGFITGADMPRARAAAGLFAPCYYEYLQSIGKAKGTFDQGDFAAYALGAIGWALFDGCARALHDSGLTNPIYGALGINRRPPRNRPELGE